MAKIEISRSYHPKDPETGEEQPMRSHFRVEGVGMGIAEIYHPKNQMGEYLLSFAQVRVVFVLTPPDDLSETEVIDRRFLPPEHTPLEVVSTPSLLEPSLVEVLEL